MILIINSAIFWIWANQTKSKKKKPNSGTKDYLIDSNNALDTSWNYSAGVQCNCIMRFKIVCIGVSKCPLELKYGICIMTYPPHPPYVLSHACALQVKNNN